MIPSITASIRARAVILLCAIIPSAALAQESGTVFFDHDWRETDEAHGFYRRTFERIDDSLFAIEDYFPWGALAMRGTMYGYMPGDRKHGQVQSFHQSGELREIVTYVRGREEGDVQRWHPNGKLALRGQYGEGRRVGIFSQWYSDGNLEWEGAYRGNEKHGPWTYWHANGEVRARGSYDRGVESGRWEWLYEDGEREGVGEYDAESARGVRTWYDRAGRVVARDTVVEGRIAGGVYTDRDGREHRDASSAYRAAMPAEIDDPAQIGEYFARSVSYPEIARRQEIEGVVVLFVVIDREGRVVSTRVEFSSDAILDAAAIEIVRRVEWRPALRHGVPALDHVIVPVRFELH